MELGLQIMMGLNCNFACRHCLNSSGPGNRKADFSEVDAESILASIRENPSIASIGFSGGEPLLYLDQIENLLNSISSIRSLDSLSISITTNGSLIPKYFERIKNLKIDKALLSYDAFHADYLSVREFEDVVVQSKMLFKSVEINLVMEGDIDLDLVKKVALDHDIRVQTSMAVESGRYKLDHGSNQKLRFANLQCPNLQDTKLIKISYFPRKGYSMCCGPLIFDDHKAEDIVAFKSVGEVLNSEMYKALMKTQDVFVKIDSTLDCNSCTNLFKKKLIKKYLHNFNQENSWLNFYDTSEFTSSNLEQLDMLFQPKIVYSAPKSSLKEFRSTIEAQGMKVDFSSNLSKDELKQASDFTRESFYSVHDNHYYESDLQRFYTQQEYFFALKTHLIRHFDSNGDLVAFLALGLIDIHPHFKEPVWHVGYWGMSKKITDRSERNNVKNIWYEALTKLNQENRIVSLVDYFNKPAIAMANSFNLEPVGYRLDART